jgi:hypothetical protein
VTDITPWKKLEISLRDNRQAWYDFIESWCDDKHHFLREYGFPFRHITRDIEQVTKQIYFYCSKMHNSSYITIYDYKGMREVENPSNPMRKHIPDYQRANINKVYFETDTSIHDVGGNLQETHDDILALYDYYGGKCRLYFTGGMGFHLFIDLTQHLSRTELRQYALFICNGLKLKTLCHMSFGDYARITRIPYTVHNKTSCFMIPVTRDMTLKEIVNASKVFHEPKPIVRTKINIMDKVEVIMRDYELNRTKIAKIKAPTRHEGEVPCVVEKRGKTIRYAYEDIKRLSG